MLLQGLIISTYSRGKKKVDYQIGHLKAYINFHIFLIKTFPFVCKITATKKNPCSLRPSVTMLH